MKKKEPIIFSHSKMNLLLEDIYSYYLKYIFKLESAEPNIALQVGNAVHYGIEKETDNLDELFQEKGNMQQQFSFSNQQALAEAMVKAYLQNKPYILNHILDNCGNVEAEYRELELQADMQKSQHKFLGVIDLLYLTEKGWVVIDYKTSSLKPNYEDYIEQLYRYCFLLERNFTEIPVYKIAIISLRKTKIKQKNNESQQDFKRRLANEYLEKADEYITYHIFESLADKEIFNREVLNNYYDNLEQLIKYCGAILDLNLMPVNYKNAKNLYGNSPFFDLIYFNEERAKANLRVKDNYYNYEFEEDQEYRGLNDLDLEVIKSKDVNKAKRYIVNFEKFKGILDNNQHLKDIKEFKELLKVLKKDKYIFNDDLIKQYQERYQKIN